MSHNKSNSRKSSSAQKSSHKRKHSFIRIANEQYNPYFQELSSMTKSKIGEILLTVAEDEIIIEQQRQMLAGLKEFEPYSAFTRIDRDGKGFIVSRDLQHFINFMQIMLPCDDAYLRAAATQRPHRRTAAHSRLSPTVEQSLSLLLENEINFHLIIEQQKKDLENCPDFNARRAFKALDELKYNFINEANLKIFLRNMGHQVIKKELVAILRRLDLDGDSKISFQEFAEGIKPVSPSILPQDIREQTIQESPLKTMKKVEAERQLSPERRHHSSSKKQRPRSADKTSSSIKNSTKDNFANQVMNQSYMNDSPNKSVTFNNNLQIQEFEKESQNRSAILKKSPIVIQENRSPYNAGGTKASIMTESFLKTPTHTFDQLNTGLEYSATTPQRLNQPTQPSIRPNQSTIENSTIPQVERKLDLSQQSLKFSPLKSQQSNFHGSANNNSKIKEELLKTMIDQVYLEKEIENIKTEFANASEFSCMAVFKIFDYHQKGYLTINDMADAAIELTGSYQGNLQKDILLIFRRYDQDNDGRLNFQEFCKMLVPLDVMQSIQVTKRQDLRLSHDGLETLRKLTKAHLNIEQSHEYLRDRVQKLLQSENTSVQKGFTELDRGSKGYLSLYDIEDLLSEYKRLRASEVVKDAEFILNLYDKKQEKRLSARAFQDELTPKVI
ncbi:ef hand family protein [Stylonychia lemnae]|uniref:Ef hand family protein n=1 Tax=Stylonychia lemnae TaxID=5949 RepID=A0A078ARV9_STYLE|nr:ef hand family protein [Stylonychia lemnae]|eukprot:CDW85220.1 ef hand family protein [Stylonychia lemnae]